jgi:hypothetical protein
VCRIPRRDAAGWNYARLSNVKVRGRVQRIAWDSPQSILIVEDEAVIAFDLEDFQPGEQ